MFDINDEVVCVNDNDPPQGDNGPFVIKGRKYTVSGFNIYIDVSTGQAGQTIFVAELPAPRGVGWYAFRFRKVEKKTTDISVFTEIINKANVPEKVS